MVMDHPDVARARLRKIIDDFKVFCDGKGAISEADTRAKVITRVLTQVCLWPETEIIREETTDAGRLDYRLLVFGKPHIVVEAKRSDIAFTLPVGGERPSYQLDGALMTDAETKKAILQVRNYCDEEGVRYAIAQMAMRGLFLEQLGMTALDGKKDTHACSRLLNTFMTSLRPFGICYRLKPWVVAP
jgi:hypothetical protein